MLRSAASPNWNTEIPNNPLVGKNRKNDAARERSLQGIDTPGISGYLEVRACFREIVLHKPSVASRVPAELKQNAKAGPMSEIV